jgi:endoglucanase
MELAKRLCDTYGPAGREGAVRELIKAEIKNYCKDIATDRLGNLIAHIPATRKNADKIMLCAHMDEIGLIVTHVDKKGFLRFTNIGGIFRQRILYERVIFENGVVGVIGVETKPETPDQPRMDNMYIDIGAKDRAEAEAMVRIGDIAAFCQNATLLKKRLLAKALDDRIGCYCLIETMKQVKAHKNDLYFVFTVQEEVGLRGARTGAYAIAPTYAIAIDVTDTGDTPESSKMAVSIGKGVAIKVKDSGFISNPAVKEKLVDYAQEAGIPYQLEILEHGTTDAAMIQVVKQGVLSGVLSIPTRYIHSTNELCDLADIKATVDLLLQVCKKGLSPK